MLHTTPPCMINYVLCSYCVVVAFVVSARRHSHANGPCHVCGATMRLAARVQRPRACAALLVLRVCGGVRRWSWRGVATVIACHCVSERVAGKRAARCVGARPHSHAHSASLNARTEPHHRSPLSHHVAISRGPLSRRAHQPRWCCVCEYRRVLCRVVCWWLRAHVWVFALIR